MFQTNPESRFVVGSGPHVHPLELTVYCVGRRSLLTDEAWLLHLARIVDEALPRHSLDLTAFAFLPNQLRLLVTPRSPADRIPWLLCGIRRRLSQYVKLDLRERGDVLLRELTVREGRGRYAFRFWEPGPGTVRVLHSGEEVAAAIDAIHDSAVRADLCSGPADWKWSSWRWYHDIAWLGDPALPRVCPVAMGSLTKPAECIGSISKLPPDCRSARIP